MRPYVAAPLLCWLVVCASLAAADSSLDGLWRSNDTAGKPRAYIRIHLVGDHYEGVIERVFPGVGETTDKVCSLCTDERHDQRILGMKVLDGLRRNGDSYGGGNVLDADNGKVYRATITPSPDGQRLDLRGYIGIPLFGRTAVWTRVEE